MAVMLLARELKGHDWGKPNLDPLAVFYIVFAVAYTALLLLGFLALWRARHSAAVKLRGFSTICSAVLFLHIYLVLIFLAYPLNGLYKCGIEFWVMSIILPLGVALFQASNIRLLSYYDEQQKLVVTDYLEDMKRKKKKARGLVMARWRELTVVQKTHLFICVGAVVQFLVTVFLFFGSRRFHSSYGFFSTYVNAGQCRRGAEWIPSVFWQFLWCSVFGPFVLLKIRRIHDVHYWALQTRLAVIAGLPGTPLWLAFVYSDNTNLARINRWWIPAGWFVPGLITMQLVSILFPLLGTRRHVNIDKKGRDSLDGQSMSSQEKNKDIYSMASLEMQISKNVDPLLRWAAQKEFTAENIVFLRAVRDFKKKWSLAAKRGPLNEDQMRDRFEEAALIFFTLVNPSTAKFNINIDYRTLSKLESIFAGLRYEPFVDDDASSAHTTAAGSESNVITPWTAFEPPSSSQSQKSCTSSCTTACADHTSHALSLQDSADVKLPSDVDKLYQLPVTEISGTPVAGVVSLGEKGEMDGDAVEVCDGDEAVVLNIPQAFSLEVFDKAYDSVKNDVFLNTWLRYEARFSKPKNLEAGVSTTSVCQTGDGQGGGSAGRAWRGVTSRAAGRGWVGPWRWGFWRRESPERGRQVGGGTVMEEKNV